jgi:hypothetical protein
MRQAKSKLGLSERALIGLVAAAALAPPAWAYVNGGDFHTTRKNYETRLRFTGWRVSCADPAPADYDVNQLVGRAVKSLPEKEADKVPVEVKREVARVARAAIREAVWGRRQVIKEGQTGLLKYQVGAYAFESYWETNYGGKREIHARQTGLVPFVAVRVVNAEEQAKPQP